MTFSLDDDEDKGELLGAGNGTGRDAVKELKCQPKWLLVAHCRVF